jgi:16S rRNA processing protein RimM
MAGAEEDTLIPVGRFGAAHGVRGEVRLKSYTDDPLAIAGYGPLRDKAGRSYEIAAARPAAGSSSPDMLVVRVDGVTTREAAEALNNLEVSVPRDRLPEAEEDEFYHGDLIGLSAATVSGEPFGTVIAVQNFGAGDLLDVARPGGRTVLIPFTKAAVPEIDVKGGRLVVDPPAGLLDEDKAGDGDEP